MFYSMDLIDDHEWIKAKWLVYGTNILVDHTYEYTLKNGSVEKDDGRNYADNPETTIHHGNGVIRGVDPLDKYSDSPKEGWTIKVSWTVQSINDYP